MNPRIALIFSLFLNVVFVVLLVLRPSTVRTENPATRVAVAPAESSGPKRAQAPGSPTSSVATVTNTLVRKIDWRNVESADYRQYIENLRSIGCPDATIRDIILADVNKLYEEKKKQIRGGPKKFEFWKAGNPMAAMLGNPETLKQMRALEEEKAGVLRALGIEPDAMTQLMAAAGGNPMDAMFDFLPEEKRTQVTKVMADFQSKMMEKAQDAATDPGGVMKIQKDMEAAIKGVLTPEEFLDYQMRFSITANTMRMQSVGFDSSEKEFLDVFKLKSAFDEEHSPYDAGNLTEAQQKERRAAQEKLNQTIKETLGEKRYSEYERSQDYLYQQLHGVVTRAKLPPTVANEVYDMRKTVESHVRELRSRNDLQGPQLQSALQAVRQEAERSIQQTLGPEAWEQYNRPNNTWWLRNIAPTAPPQAPAPVPPPVPN